MPYVIVAARTGQPPSPIGDVRRVDRESQLAMTLAASLFSDFLIAPRNAQRVGVPPRREIERMPESVLCFRQVLRDESRRRVAVVANSHGPMARARPRVEVILHDVAVGTRPGI